MTDPNRCLCGHECGAHDAAGCRDCDCVGFEPEEDEGGEVGYIFD